MRPILAKRKDVAGLTADIIGMLAAFVVGSRLSDVPASPAFAVFRRDVELWLNKAQRHFRGLIFPGAALFLFAVTYGPHSRHSALVILGLALGIIEQHTRYAVFQLRLRLTGADNYAEHMAGRILPVLARVAPSRVPSRLSFDSASDWVALWDIYAMRVMPSASRTLFRRSPRVFISYRWADEQDRRDADIAAALAGTLKTEQKTEDGVSLAPAINALRPRHAGVPHFLDKRVLKRGLAFRSRVAIEIAEATHFILLLSKRTVTGKTCGDEARQALACLPISMWPRIVLCLLDTEEDIRGAGGDPVFAYLLDRADRIPLEELTNRAVLLRFLRRTSPESFLTDFARNFLRLPVRQSNGD